MCPGVGGCEGEGGSFSKHSQLFSGEGEILLLLFLIEGTSSLIERQEHRRQTPEVCVYNPDPDFICVS